MDRLTYPSALVTGATTAAAATLARHLSRAGFTVILAGDDKSATNRQAAHLSDSTGQSTESLLADASTMEGTKTLIAKLREDASITVLVNALDLAAAMPARADSLLDPVAQTVRLADAAAAVFTQRGRGRILTLVPGGPAQPTASPAWTGSMGYLAAFVAELDRQGAPSQVHSSLLLVPTPVSALLPRKGHVPALNDALARSAVAWLAGTLSDAEAALPLARWPPVVSAR